MKCSESWLREWVNPDLTHEELDNALTMGGLEVEDISSVAEPFNDVIIGEISAIEKHSNAEKLQLCKVNIGQNTLLNIVCGAANARANLKVAVAKLGAQLPDGKVITPTEIRGIASEGMLCSASELKLSDDNQGILELPATAPVGMPYWQYLMLSDHSIDISITPNRGDCLSIRGVARDLSALTNTPLTPIEIASAKETLADVLPINVKQTKACPRYVARIIREVAADAQTPVIIKERLRRSGIRSISPIVDVTNYVMLELGQPMHAFDLQKIQTEINVRWSKQGEIIALLDGTEKTLDAETLVIADINKPLAIAGVMGGVDSCVTPLTKDILLESAFFTPQVIARQRQYYNLNSDSAYRFERGVDYKIQREAIERATQLILEICGGEAGKIVEKESTADLPKAAVITITQEAITNVLGISIPPTEIEDIFARLQFSVTKNTTTSWQVTVPSYRYDLTIPEDLIEEVARLYGYNKIPIHQLQGLLLVNKAQESSDLTALRLCLRDLDYHEIVSYSFVSEALQKMLDPEQAPRTLVNPITADMSVMRTNLWAGLINTYIYNNSRQQQRIRLFELGTCFITQDQTLSQPLKLGGLICGNSHPEQWGVPNRPVDFYDLKGDVETLLNALGHKKIIFKPIQHPALHPGQAAGVYKENNLIGIIGALHPSLTRKLDLSETLFLLEFDVKSIISSDNDQLQEISKYPEIRRDLAMLINETIPAQEIQDTIRNVAGSWLKELFIFDVYQGKGVPAGFKSIALALVVQHPTRTLVDEEVAEFTSRIVDALKKQLGAELRS